MGWIDEKLSNMTRDEIYLEGYRDGFEGKELLTELRKISDYFSGWTDGHGDRELQEEEARPVDDEYYAQNSPPTEFVWVGEKRTPEPGDFYLSKAGNPIFSWKERKNSQQRHLLYLRGHEGHELLPSKDNVKTNDVMCKTCNRWVRLSTQKV